MDSDGLARTGDRAHAGRSAAEASVLGMLRSLPARVPQQGGAVTVVLDFAAPFGRKVQEALEREEDPLAALQPAHQGASLWPVCLLGASTVPPPGVVTLPPRFLPAWMRWAPGALVFAPTDNPLRAMGLWSSADMLATLAGEMPVLCWARTPQEEALVEEALRLSGLDTAAGQELQERQETQDILLRVTGPSAPGRDLDARARFEALMSMPEWLALPLASGPVEPGHQDAEGRVRLLGDFWLDRRNGLVLEATQDPFVGLTGEEARVYRTVTRVPHRRCPWPPLPASPWIERVYWAQQVCSELKEL